MIIKDKLLLKPEDFKPSFPEWHIDGVLNPAAVRMQNKKIFLYARIAEHHVPHGETALTCPIITSQTEYETSEQKIKKREIESQENNLIYLKSGICRLTNISHFRKVILSQDGFNVESISNDPNFVGRANSSEYGVEDPRIVYIDGKYFMTYVSVSVRTGVSSCLAVSRDLDKWERKGVIFREQNKDSVLFPEKINGRYMALNRPEVFYDFHRPGVWISYSPDLVYWGRENSLFFSRGNSWENERIGAGAPPIRIKEGWLLIYHGVENKDGGNIYSVGAILLDLKNPERILARSPADGPLIPPTKSYEKEGFMKNVVFPTGAVIDLNGKDLLIYSGGADSVVSVKKIPIRDILESMEFYK